jgi:hypothetical protein
MRGINKVSIKGKGWSSKGMVGRPPIRANRFPKDQAMLKSIKTKLYGFEVDVDATTKPI